MKVIAKLNRHLHRGYLRLTNPFRKVKLGYIEKRGDIRINEDGTYHVSGWHFDGLGSIGIHVCENTTRVCGYDVKDLASKTNPKEADLCIRCCSIALSLIGPLFLLAVILVVDATSEAIPVALGSAAIMIFFGHVLASVKPSDPTA